MKYTKKDLGSYNLHMINTNKFKTITVRVVFRRKIKKEEVTIRNILTSLLLLATKNYDTKRKLSIKAQDLYSAGVSVNNTRSGNYLNTVFSLNVLNDKYTEKDNFKNSLDFLNEIIFNPCVEDDGFLESNIDLAITNARTNLASIKEDSYQYSLLRSLESFDKNSPASIRISGYLEDLDKINGKDLYKNYKEMINKDLVDIFVIGDINEKELLENIKNAFKLRVLKKAKTNYRLEEKNARTRRLFAKETIPNNQSNVNIICRLKGLSDYEREYVLPMYNVILGGGVDSKLFQEVREKNSLCYTIGSKQVKLDNILMIHTGIDKNNFQKAFELIEKNMKDMRFGKFSEDDISVAKEYFHTAYDEIEESPESIINVYMSKDFLGTDELEERRRKIEKVTKNEIIKVAKKVKIDTIFTLEGVNDEKERI